MHKITAYFSVIFLLLALTMLFSVLYFNMPLLLMGNKIVLLTFINSIIMVFVGIFFFMFRDRIILYLDNYRREKQI